jgi:hypothetical protein
VVEVERAVQPGRIDVEAVRVLHGELAHAQQAALRARLVAELRLELVPDLRQLPVRAKLAGHECEDLLVRHAERQVRALAVTQPEHLVAHDLPAPGAAPHLGRMHRREQELLAPDPVHLVPDDVHDLGPDAGAERQQRVVAGHQLPDVATPHE